MKIMFKLSYSNESEKNLRDDFCNFIVTSMSHDIVDGSNIVKVKVLSDKILSEKWISWIRNPVYHDPYYLLVLIANNLRYTELRDGSFIIEINPNVFYPGSRTKLERFVRFLDKGNMTIRGSYIFTEVFTKYSEQLIDLWKKYKSNKLRTYNIENSFVIK